MDSPVIGFAGLTHLGITSQAAAAALGFTTVGYHPDPELVRQLSRGEPPITEPGLPQLLEEHSSRLSFAVEPQSLVHCDVVYISVDVPTDGEGLSDLSSVEEMICSVSDCLKDGVVLVVLCQVPPGFTRRIPNLPVPAENLYYQVETLIFGRAIERATSPERIIVGCARPDRPLHPMLNQELSAYDSPVQPKGYESAELAKIAINMCLVASVSVANTLAELCEGVGADWSEIVPALKLDRRIGPYAYLKPGLGITGGNLERDLATVVQLASRMGTEAQVIRAHIRDSGYRKEWALRKLHETALQYADGKATIGILGLAYKENTASIKNSASVELLKTLTRHGQTHRIRVFDPEVGVGDTPVEFVAQAKSALDACRGAQAIVIMTPWPEFGGLRLTEVSAAMADTRETKWVIDPFGVFSVRACQEAGLRHVTMGVRTVESIAIPTN